MSKKKRYTLNIFDFHVGYNLSMFIFISVVFVYFLLIIGFCLDPSFNPDIVWFKAIIVHA